MMGNVATEALLAELKRLGAELPEMRPIESLVAANAEIVRRYGRPVQ
jgi:hydroxymethylglutaryl-CoA lyase